MPELKPWSRLLQGRSIKSRELATEQQSVLVRLHVAITIVYTFLILSMRLTESSSRISEFEESVPNAALPTEIVGLSRVCSGMFRN